MRTYRIEYKWREFDYGQDMRPWQHFWAIIESESIEQAIIDFDDVWKVEYKIKEIFSTGVGPHEKQVFE
jgi:hypothetical protein